jgi:hypothetical protein
MQEGHASVCAVCPQHTGCTPADATTDSCDLPNTGTLFSLLPQYCVLVLLTVAAEADDAKADTDAPRE